MPKDTYAIRNPGSVQRDWTLADMQGDVTRAEAAGGGWLVLTFHEVCATMCPTTEPYGIERSTFITDLGTGLAPAEAEEPLAP